MKPYLTIEEAKNIIRLIKSKDEEIVILGLYLLIGKSFKTTKHLTSCINNAKKLLMILNKEYKYENDIYNCKIKIFNSLNAYIYSQSKYL